MTLHTVHQLDTALASDWSLWGPVYLLGAPGSEFGFVQRSGSRWLRLRINRRGGWDVTACASRADAIAGPFGDPSAVTPRRLCWGPL